jgi:SAM-dependent methyltransferase
MAAIRVNVGCGATPTEGWTNLDNSLTVRLARWRRLVQVFAWARIIDSSQAAFAAIAREKTILYANAAKSLPFEKGSVDVIYSSHMVEHLDREEAARFLAACRVVLRAGGIIRLVLPDLKRIIDDYARTGDADAMVERTLLASSRRKGIVGRTHALLVGSRHHLWMYDGRSATKLLIDAGFVGATELAPGQTTIPEPGLLDLSERADESFYLEARKPVD